MFGLLCDGADMAVLERQLCRMLHGVNHLKFNEHVSRQRKHCEPLQDCLIQLMALCAICLNDIEKQLHFSSLFQHLLQKRHCQ